jgi:hypothetical protein
VLFADEIRISVRPVRSQPVRVVVGFQERALGKRFDHTGPLRVRIACGVDHAFHQAECLRS